MAELNGAQLIAQRKALVGNVGKDEFVQEPKERTVILDPSRMKLSEYERSEWVVNAEIETTIEDLTKPEYWAHMAQQMQPYDHIEVRAEDGSWLAELLVVQVERNWAKVMVKAKYDLTGAENIEVGAPQHKVEWKGPQHRFAVIRLSDSVMVRKDFKTKREAEDWMREHERVITG